MDKYLTDKIYWEKRSEKYDKLQWAKRENYITNFIKMCEVDNEDIALDLGTGTGTIAYALRNNAGKIVGVDFSEDMLREARRHNHIDNVQFINADIRALPFRDNTFDIVTARMVFHHLLWGLNKAMDELKRVLKKGGLFCLSEGVPPDRCVEDFYKIVFKLKEKRRTFFPEDLEKLMIIGGFKKIKKKEFIMKHCSIKNWLSNDVTISDDVKRKIYKMHINLHENGKGKKAYNMHITPEDCFIDMKFIIISGRK